MGSDRRSSFDRERALRRLADEEFDVVVVGGGITGCGVALDATVRGWRTALVEAHDFAYGTSSKSSKLVHGGLRYLQQREYRLVYEALAERQRLIENAPHLVHPVPFLVPLFGRAGVANKGVAQAYAAALWVYDVTGGVRIGHWHRRISAATALAHFPTLRTDRLVAGFLYWDAQTDDARLTLAIARTAAERGAVVANQAPVARFLPDAAGRVRGVALADGTEVRARVVVNSGGVWTEDVARLDAGQPPIAIRPAKGVHVAVPSERLPCDYAAVLSVPGDKRSVFVVPWDAAGAREPSGPARYTYVGTTDTDYDGPLDAPTCTPEDVAYLLGAANAWTSAGLTPADVTGSWAGLRPLVADATSERTADLSRRHKVSTSGTGVVTITGGKLTTYRRMAADTVDAVEAVLAEAGGEVGPAARPARGSAVRARARRAADLRHGPATRHLRLIGAPPTRAVPPELDGPAAADRWGVDPATLAHLFRRYGTETADVLALADGDADLRRPLAAGLPYLRAEVVWAARHEMARTVTDVLSRRTRAHLLHRAAARTAAPDVAALLEPELGWPPGEGARQVREYEALVDAEAAAEQIAPVRPGP